MILLQCEPWQLDIAMMEWKPTKKNTTLDGMKFMY